ncbi:MAG: GNAT family N-acetyltransferase [Cyclobacteriaceae bacterium]|nr:GNAT family N-acetyltransferase [Cyclobacteriaceae bacterium]
MITREAKLADVPSILDFQLKMALETENVQLEILPLTQGVHRLMKDPTKGKYYVAEEGGEVIGCLMTTYEWSDWRCGTVIWIQSVYVSAGWRGKGVYKKLYQHIRDLVENDPDLKGIRLYVDKKNRHAQDVYAALGMNGEHYTVFEWMKG